MVLQKNINDDIDIAETAEKWIGNPLFDNLLLPAIKDCKKNPVEPIVVGVTVDDCPFLYASALSLTKIVRVPSYRGGFEEIPFTFHIAMDISQEYAIQSDKTTLFYAELGSHLEMFDHWQYMTKERFKKEWLESIRGWGTVK